MERAKEVGLRKVVGAPRRQLIVQFLFESVVVNMIALVLAAILVVSCMPFINGFIGKDISSGFFTTGLGSTVNFWLLGVLKDNTFWEWYKKISNNEIANGTITIKLLEKKDKVVMQWLLHNTLPIKITETDLKSTGNEVAVEAIEIGHEGLTISNS